jgi:deoxycytidylate deaminase
VMTMKNAVFCDVMPCDSCKNDVSEERIPSIISVKSISSHRTALASYC